MKRVESKITISELKRMSENMFGGLVKAVVDIEKEIMIVDAPMHADEEKTLLESNSSQSDLWGINLYPEMYGDDDFVGFDSMINIRPNQNNRSRGVEDQELGDKILRIVEKLVTE